jgi:ribosomal protein S18 acetylase RimI-like enzyme
LGKFSLAIEAEAVFVNALDCGHTIRQATEADMPAIRAALASALDWRAQVSSRSPEELIKKTGHAYLLEDWGRAGDKAYVAERGGSAVGAAWYRYWTDVLHSYGYVDSSTPEIGLGVDLRFRRRGIGTSLMVRLLAGAKKRGVPLVSLSVERDNPALLLYRRLGFEHCGPRERLDDGEAPRRVRVLSRPSVE